MEKVQIEYGSTDISFLRSEMWKMSHKQIHNTYFCFWDCFASNSLAFNWCLDYSYENVEGN